MADRPVALVTGAARGIGAATARRLANHGWSIAALDIAAPIDSVGYDMGGAAELADVAARCGNGSIAIEADVRDQEQLDDAVSRTVSEVGQLDAAVAAAGVIAGGAPTWQLDDAVWAVNLDVNLTGVYRTIRAAVPALLDRPEPRHGRIVAIASAASFSGHELIGGYAAAKHGVLGLIRTLAIELGDTGITANAVCPGSVDTPTLAASAALYGLDSVEEFAVHHPIGRLLEPDEIASAVAWLCSSDQAGVTGMAMSVDGGMTI